MIPTKRITDPAFRYTPSHLSDIRPRLEAERERLKAMRQASAENRGHLLIMAERREGRK